VVAFSRHVFANAGFADVDAELEQFSMRPSKLARRGPFSTNGVLQPLSARIDQIGRRYIRH
jgi:hypothetical protein